MEARDRSLKGAGRFRTVSPSMSLLGMVPLLSKTDASNGQLLPSTNPLGPRPLKVFHNSEGLLLSNPGQLPSSVLITSPGVNEGKTTLAVNLATAMAQLEDMRVILIDAGPSERPSSSHF